MAAEPFDPLDEPISTGGAAPAREMPPAVEAQPVPPVAISEAGFMRHRHAADSGLAPGGLIEAARTAGHQLGCAVRWFRERSANRTASGTLYGVESWARGKPEQSIAGAVLAGFLLGRLIWRR